MSVVSISQFKKNKEEAESTTPVIDVGLPKEETFEEVMKRNKEKQDRLKADRTKDNRGVIRSYGLK